MVKPTLFMLIGLPGAGKSSYAEQLIVTFNTKIFSSDEIRKELYNDASVQENNEKVFNILHERIKSHLLNGQSAIYDATNISSKRRMAYLNSIKKVPCEKIAIFMATPYEKCLYQNSQRKRKVPNHVIEKMYRNFNPPHKYEGWDDIWVCYSENSKNSYGYPEDWIFWHKNYDQENSHHNKSLGNHMQICYEQLADFGSPILRLAGALHDCGKPFCKTFINAKGEQTEEAHYYQHEHVGAYDSFFFNLYNDSVERHLEVATLINWHMRPYTAWKSSKKCEEKERKILGEELFQNIQYLHWADKNAH